MRVLCVILSLFSVTSMAQAQMASKYTPYELDVLEAHLNKQWKHAEEIASAHSRFVAIRQDLVINGYQLEMKQWFQELESWYDAWGPILEVMKGSALADPQARDMIGKRLKEQMIKLDSLTSRVQVINKVGQSAADELAKLPIFPPDYIDVVETSNEDSYAAQITVYHEQLAVAKARLQETRANFNTKITDGLQAISQALDSAITSRAAALGSSFPELKAALELTKESLVHMRKADTLVAKMREQSRRIAADLANQKIYTAMKGLELWKLDVDKALNVLGKEPGMTSGILAYARQLIQVEINIREATLMEALKSNPALDIFIAYYEKQLYGTGGLVELCLSAKSMKSIDCNRIRQIQGFEYEQLKQLTDKQAAYIESQIEKSRRGRFSSIPR